MWIILDNSMKVGFYIYMYGYVYVMYKVSMLVVFIRINIYEFVVN